MLNSNLEKNVEKGYQSLGRSILLVGRQKVRFSLALLSIMFVGGALAMLIWNVSSTFNNDSIQGSLALLPGVELNTTQAAANSTLLFNPASVSVAGDQQFSLDARINPGTNAVSAVELHVTYDQTKFRLDSITASSPFTLELAAASINNTNGTASIALAVPLTSPSVTTTSTIATFSFHSLASVTGSSIAFTAASIASADGESGNAIITRTPATVTVDGTAPTITTITSSQANGTYTTGAVIPINLTFSEAATSTGNVTVTLETGTTDRTCTFTVSNSTTGSCNYTVQAGDTTTDLNVNTVSGVIRDQAGNAMTNFVPTTNLAANKALVIDTTAPTNQQTVFSTSVSVAGGASVTIVSSGDSTNNVWFAPSGTTNFVASATMTKAANGSSTTILAPATGGSYKLFVIDAAGNVSTASTATLTVDSVPPTITTITSSQANGTYTTGAVIPINLTFSEAATSTGNVTVTLETGTTDRTCTFTVSNSTTGSCNYTVQAGDTTTDLNVNTVSGVIRDQAGNAMTNFVPTTNLAANKALVIDTTTPVISVVSAIPSITRDSTPYYVFNATKPGTITYGGGCSSSTTAAVSGSNTVTFNTLSPGTYASCTLFITDASSNSSNTLSIASFVVTYASDLNLDRTVNVIDFGVLKTNYGTTNAAGDINSDGQVNVLDFGVLHGQYGSSV
ncbi:MAG: hypothetical protein IPJ68_00860 [Candidatus Moraniibacteriota bacterium]|nr:MAG: hypothetical protein IPJ68_00860 [Candidatus Moranbacteria bacterium]